MATNFKTKEEILKTHSLFWDAFAKRDLEKRFSICSDDITFIGTGLHEKARNKQEYRAINQKGVKQLPDPFVLEFVWTEVKVYNNVAWVESEVIWTMDINQSLSKTFIRNTTILKHENEKWWVVHVHGSIPDYRLADGEYMIPKRNKELETQVHERTIQLDAALQNLKATQAQLIQSEKMASLGELTAGIAHEIQNPLNFVNNFSDVNRELLEDLQSELSSGNRDEAFTISNELKDNEQKINHHGKRADAIVKSMLQHSRVSTAKKELTDINALADESLRLSYHGLRAKDKEFNATINTDFDETIGTINIIPQDISRVLLNLFNNAFYAVHEKKSKLNGTYEPIVSVSTERKNGSIVLKVADNGNGIPSNIVDKIFQPFFTTKPTGQGTGLGLSLSYDIIKAHGGEIKVSSKEGAGSEFIIILHV